MRRQVRSMCLSVALTLVVAGSALADDVENAYYLCQRLDATGLTSAKCEVSVWNSSVTTTIDMSSGEARDLCSKLSNHMVDQKKLFDRTWTLQIKSPFSGENSVAFCNLQRF